MKCGARDESLARQRWYQNADELSSMEILPSIRSFILVPSLCCIVKTHRTDHAKYDQFDHSNAMPFVCALRGFHVYNKLTKTYSTHAERNLKKKKRKWKNKKTKQDKLLLVCLEFSLYFIYNPSAFVIARTAPNSFSWYIFISRD